MWSIISYTNKISGKVLYVAVHGVPKGMEPTMGDIAKHVKEWMPSIFETKEAANAYVAEKMNTCSDCGGTICDCCYTSEELGRMAAWKPTASKDDMDENDLLLAQFPELWYSRRNRSLQHILIVGCNCSGTEVCGDCR